MEPERHPAPSRAIPRLTVSLLFGLLLSAPSSSAQEQRPAATPVGGELENSRGVVTPRVLGKIADGSPPPPAAPRPKFKVRPQDIVSTRTHQQGGRTITLRKIQAMDLPSPPPAEPAAVLDDPEIRARLAAYRAQREKSGLLFLSATVYRSKAAAPRTRVRYSAGEGGEVVSFWSSADFGLISGIHSFVDSTGKTQGFFMAWGNVEVDRPNRKVSFRKHAFKAPIIPDFSAGAATWQIIGEQPSAADLAVIESIHQLYNSKLVQLKDAHRGRERARKKREAELKANPPRPKDITLTFWRSEKPAAERKGGSSR